VWAGLEEGWTAAAPALPWQVYPRLGASEILEDLPTGPNGATGPTFGGSYSNPNTNDFLSPMGNLASTEADTTMPVQSGTVKKLFGNLDSALATGKTATVTVYKNGNMVLRRGQAASPYTNQHYRSITSSHVVKR
jgi:hypothetical protein